MYLFAPLKAYVTQALVTCSPEVVGSNRNGGEKDMTELYKLFTSDQMFHSGD